MYRTISTSLWREPWFRKLSPEAKCIFLFLWTGGELRPNGIGFIDRERLAFELGVTPEQVRVALEDELNERIMEFSKHGMLAVKDYATNQGSGPKWQRAIEKADLDTNPEIIDTLSKGYPTGTGTVQERYPIDRVSQEQEQLPPTEGETQVSPPATFKEWLEKADQATDKVAVLCDMAKTMWSRPLTEDYGGRAAALLKAAGKENSGLAVKVLWQVISEQPAGDLFTYAIATMKRIKERNNDGKTSGSKAIPGNRPAGAFSDLPQGN